MKYQIRVIIVIMNNHESFNQTDSQTADIILLIILDLETVLFGFVLILSRVSFCGHIGVSRIPGLYAADYSAAHRMCTVDSPIHSSHTTGFDTAILIELIIDVQKNKNTRHYENVTDSWTIP